MTYLIDTYGAPSNAELQMPGCVGATRYISHTLGKNVTHAQVHQIHQLGKVVVLNFEDSSTNAVGGHSQGVTDAQFAFDEARALGAPEGIAIYFSVDYEIHSGFGVVDDYVRGVRSVLRPAGYLTGVYGDADLTMHLAEKKLADFTWQTAAWSYGKRDPGAEFVQDVFTPGYDKDEIEHRRYGGWGPSSGPQKPPANPQPNPGVNMLQAIRVLRAIVVGGKYATPKLKKHYPQMVHEQGLVDRIRTLENQVKKLEEKRLS